MSSPLTTDIQSLIDPTGYASISGAQLFQILSALFPQNDKGMIIATADSGGNPTVPDARTDSATTSTKWQRYFWLRIGATAVTVYVWNPTAAVDATLLQWVSINQAAIGPGSIIGTMIADNTIPANKIISLDWSQLTGVPTTFSPGGAAGGDLSGTFPAPVIAPKAVTSDKIGDKTITAAQIANTTITLALLAAFSGSAKDMCRVNAGATGIEAFTPPTIFTDANVTTTGNVGKVPTVATSGAGDTGTWVMKDPTTIGARILQVVETLDNTADSTSLHCDASTAPTTSNCKVSASLQAAVTPKSSDSTLMIEVGLQITNSGSSNVVCVNALFKDAGANALAAVCADTSQNTRPVISVLRFTEASGSTAARTYKAGFASASASAYLNSVDGATKMFGGTLGAKSWIRVTEYI